MLRAVAAVYAAELDEVETAMLEWVNWFNHRLIPQRCDDLTPDEFEQAYSVQNEAP